MNIDEDGESKADPANARETASMTSLVSTLRFTIVRRRVSRSGPSIPTS